MDRRDFLSSAAAGIAVLCSRRSEAAQPSNAIQVRQLQPDHFALDFSATNDRAVRILQLTDTHFGNPEPAYQQRDRRSFEMISKLVARHKPDFVMHTGDFINNDRGRKVSFEACDFMDGLGVPWSHALGNHDIGAVPIEDYRQRLKNAAFGFFDADGKREYAFRLDVMARGTSKPAWTIFCFDSGFRMPRKHVSPGQIAWFERQLSADRQRDCSAPALAMIHIPMIEFDKLRSNQEFDGIFGEQVCFESDRGTTFNKFHDSGRIKAVFSGHDHKNDYCGQYNGIELVYGRVSGWSGYGDLERGGRLIELDPASQKYTHRLVFADA